MRRSLRRLTRGRHDVVPVIPLDQLAIRIDAGTRRLPRHRDHDLLLPAANAMLLEVERLAARRLALIPREYADLHEIIHRDRRLVADAVRTSLRRVDEQSHAIRTAARRFRLH